MAKANYLKNMKINEVSLVTAPASPGADILFTKAEEGDWRAAVMLKAYNPHEPRDHQGRWTRIKESVKVPIGAARDYAAKLAEKAVNSSVGQKIAPHVRGAKSVVSSTRPTGAHPVEGGGVEFGFKHVLHDNSTLHTKVQIRPEHLKFIPGGEKAGPYQTGGLGEWEPRYSMASGTDMPDTVLPSTGDAPRRTPFGLRPKVHGALKRFENALRYAHVPEVPRFGSAPAAGEKGLRSLMRWHSVKAPTPLFPDSSSPSSTASSSSSLPATSDISGGVSMRGLNGLPIWSHSSAFTPRWARDIQLNPATSGVPSEDSSGRTLPFANANHQSAGGRAYYRRGAFVPGARPDVQRGIEQVHDWMTVNPHLAAPTKQAMQGNPENSGGKAYFTLHGEYVPPGDKPFQQQMQGRYRVERERVASASTRQPKPPLPLTPEQEDWQEQQRQLEHEAMAARSGYSAATALFGPEAEEEYDLGTPEQRRAAAAARNEEVRREREMYGTDRPVRKNLFPVAKGRKSLFPGIESVDPSIIKRYPAAPYASQLRWNEARGGPPAFVPFLTASNPTPIALYAKSATKARIR